MGGRASALQNTHPRHRRCGCGTGRSRNRNTSRRLQRIYSDEPALRQLARWLSTLRFVRARVLVADDQADVLEALRFLLKGADLEADFVTSPVAALDRLQERPYELLLADLNYARDTTSAGEGLELVSRARHRPPAARRRHDRVGDHRYGGRGDAPRRTQLRPEAVEQRDAAGDPQSRSPTAAWHASRICGTNASSRTRAPSNGACCRPAAADRRSALPPRGNRQAATAATATTRSPSTTTCSGCSSPTWRAKGCRQRC